MPTSISTRTPGSLNPTRQQLDELDALLQRMLELPVNQTDEKNETEEADETPPPPLVRPTTTKPPSYTVIETASPRPLPLPAASGFEPRPSPLTPPPATIVQERPQPPAADTDAPPSEAEMWVPLRSTWQPSAQTWQPLAESWRQANAAATPAAAPNPISSTPLDPPPEILPPPPAPVESVQDKDSEPPAEPVPVADVPVEPRLSLTAKDAPSEPPLLLPLLWFNQGFDACMTPLGAAGRWLCGPSGRQTLGLAGLACLAAAIVVAVSAGMAWPW